MRITRLLRRVSGVTQMFVKQAQLSVTGALKVSVVPSWRRLRSGAAAGARRGTSGTRCGCGVTRRAAGSRCDCDMRRGGWRAPMSAGCGSSACRGRRVQARSRRRSRKADGVSGAGDGPADGEQTGEGFVGTRSAASSNVLWLGAWTRGDSKVGDGLARRHRVR